MGEKEDEDSYESLYGVKKKKLDPTKNPNYRRVDGLGKLIITLKKERGIISNQNRFNEDEKNQYLRGFNTIIEYYEIEIKKVKEQLSKTD